MCGPYQCIGIPELVNAVCTGQNMDATFMHRDLCHFLHWSYTLRPTSLNLRFRICKMGMVTSSSRGTWEGWWCLTICSSRDTMTSFPSIDRIFQGTEPYFWQKVDVLQSFCCGFFSRMFWDWSDEKVLTEHLLWAQDFVGIQRKYKMCPPSEGPVRFCCSLMGSDSSSHSCLRWERSLESIEFWGPISLHPCLKNNFQGNVYFK